MTEEPRTIRFATYNIAGAHINTNANFADRLPSIVALLRDAALDVICLQEVAGPTREHTQAHTIGDALRMNVVFGVAHERGERGVFGNAVLSRFALTRATVIQLQQGSLERDSPPYAPHTRMPGAAEQRVAIATLVCPFADARHDFWCLSTHFGILNSADASDLSIAHAPSQAIAAFVNRVENRSTPALLCGDLNALPDSNVLIGVDRNWNIQAANRPTTPRHGEIDFICDRQRRLWTMHTSPQVTVSDASDHYLLVGEWVPINLIAGVVTSGVGIASSGDAM